MPPTPRPGTIGGAPVDPDAASVARQEDLRIALKPATDDLVPGSVTLPKGLTPFGVPALPTRVPDLTREPFRPPVTGSAAWPEEDPQRLVPIDTSPNLLEGLEARVKDPLWFLARQWQTGEFEGEDGGRVAQVQVEWRSAPMDTLVRGGASAPLDLAEPLEAAVEAELVDGSSPAWLADHLEYAFNLTGSGATLVASEYDGTHLDWYHFDLDRSMAAGGPATTTRILPKNLRFEGMPHPRWWRFEPGDVDLTRIVSAQPNQLQLLLAEFLMADSNNWYVLPLELPAGHLRQVTRLSVVDAFGIASDLPPALGPWGHTDWELFSLTATGPLAEADGSFLYVPHAAVNVTEADLVESVELIRDEVANMAWAVERFYTDVSGVLVNRGDVESLADRVVDGLADPAMLSAETRSLEVFRLASMPPRHWIPYLPRRAPAPPGMIDPQVYLRRGRTDPDATRAFPQHRTRIVAESWRINEEELPRTGIAVERRWRFARRSDGELALWIGRRKELRASERSAAVDFDFLLAGE